MLILATRSHLCGALRGSSGRSQAIRSIGDMDTGRSGATTGGSARTPVRPGGAQSLPGSTERLPCLPPKSQQGVRSNRDQETGVYLIARVVEGDLAGAALTWARARQVVLLAIPHYLVLGTVFGGGGWFAWGGGSWDGDASRHPRRAVPADVSGGCQAWQMAAERLTMRPCACFFDGAYRDRTGDVQLAIAATVPGD